MDFAMKQRGKPMADLIDRPMAYNVLTDYYHHNTDVQHIALADALSKVPSADAVEVVRCKDCVHYMPYDWMFSEVYKSQNIEDYLQNEIGCEWIDHYVNPDDFCSFGERKDGEQNETD